MGGGGYLVLNSKLRPNLGEAGRQFSLQGYYPADKFDAGQPCSYNESYSTLKIEWYGVVVTLVDLA